MTKEKQPNQYMAIQLYRQFSKEVMWPINLWKGITIFNYQETVNKLQGDSISGLFE